MATRVRRLPLTVCVFAATLVLHPAPPAGAERSNSLSGGATSIQFLTFGGGYLPSFRTSGLYLKHHLTDRSALRIGADFTLDESSGRDPTRTDGGDIANVRSYSVTATGEYERYVDATGPVTIFVGLGPFWTRGRSSYERSNTLTYGTAILSSYHKYESRYWEIGGAAAVGFEWFFKRKLSVLGRLGASLGFGKRHEFRQSDYSDGTTLRSEVTRFDTTTARAATSSGALGLSAYF